MLRIFWAAVLAWALSRPAWAGDVPWTKALSETFARSGTQRLAALNAPSLSALAALDPGLKAYGRFLEPLVSRLELAGPSYPMAPEAFLGLSAEEQARLLVAAAAEAERDAGQRARTMLERIRSGRIAEEDLERAYAEAEAIAAFEDPYLDARLAQDMRSYVRKLLILVQGQRQRRIALAVERSRTQTPPEEPAFRIEEEASSETAAPRRAAGRRAAGLSRPVQRALPSLDERRGALRSAAAKKDEKLFAEEARQAYAGIGTAVRSEVNRLEEVGRLGPAARGWIDRVESRLVEIRTELFDLARPFRVPGADGSAVDERIQRTHLRLLGRVREVRDKLLKVSREEEKAALETGKEAQWILKQYGMKGIPYLDAVVAYHERRLRQAQADGDAGHIQEALEDVRTGRLRQNPYGPMLSFEDIDSFWRRFDPPSFVQLIPFSARSLMGRAVIAAAKWARVAVLALIVLSILALAVGSLLAMVPKGSSVYLLALIAAYIPAARLRLAAYYWSLGRRLDRIGAALKALER